MTTPSHSDFHLNFPSVTKNASLTLKCATYDLRGPRFPKTQIFVSLSLNYTNLSKKLLVLHPILRSTLLWSCQLRYSSAKRGHALWPRWGQSCGNEEAKDNSGVIRRSRKMRNSRRQWTRGIGSLKAGRSSVKGVVLSPTNYPNSIAELNFPCHNNQALVKKHTSAPEYLSVRFTSQSKSTSEAIGVFRNWIRRMSERVASSGSGTYMILSIRPGRRRAYDKMA